MQYELTGVNVIIVSLFVLWFGNLLTNKVEFLKNTLVIKFFIALPMFNQPPG